MKTITAEVVDDGNKSDARGRRIIGEERREELLALYKTSDLTQKAFARREGVNFHTFVSWLAQQRVQTGGGVPIGAKEPPVRFAQIATGGGFGMPPPGLEVVLRDGRIARGLDAQSLAALVRALEG